jgi:hypothetical protein
MKTIFTTLAIAACLSTLAAQPPPPGGGQQRQQQQGRQKQPPPPPPPNGERPPPPPIVGAIDADHDGVISAEEITGASDALKQLDQNGDRQLTPDEFCPPPPPREGNSQSQGQESRQQGNDN